MSKEFSFPNSGTCSKQTNFVLNDDHTIESMEVIGGCNGNLKGICSIVRVETAPFSHKVRPISWNF